MNAQPPVKPPADSAHLRRRGIVQSLLRVLVLPAALFGAAGRLDWPMGWLYVALLLTLMLGTWQLVARVDPSLLAERAAAFSQPDSKAWDKALVVIMALVGPLAMWVVAGLDQRFGWGPPVPGALQAVAVFVIGLGGLFTAWAMVTNRFFSAVVRIQRDRGHVVVSSGPYRFVRHPGYVGVLLTTTAGPLMLDACWAGIPAAVVVITTFVRTALEDRTLRAELAGYAEYAQHTRYRLVPGVW
jgi:protein-S-isoprenylcysteine O-methyltransferase Ste14